MKLIRTGANRRPRNLEGQATEAQELLRIIAEAAIKFVRLSPDHDIYGFICETVKGLVGDAIVAVNSFDPVQGILSVRRVLGIEPQELESLSALMGGRVMDFHFTDIDEQVRQQLFNGRLGPIPDGVYGALFHTVPLSSCLALEKQTGITGSYSIGFRRGGRLYGNCSIFTRRDAHPDKSRVETFINLVSIALERKFVEEALRASEQLYCSTIDAMDDIIHVVDEDLRFTLVNQAVIRLCQQVHLTSEVIGRSVFEVFPFLPEKVRDEYRHVFSTGEVLVTEETTRLQSREFITETRKIPIREGDRVVRVVSVVRDMSQRKKLEEELLNIRKLESLGILAGGIAHDFNNLLTSILANLSMIREFGGLPDDLQQGAVQAERAGLRARALVKQLLGFARGSAPVKALIDFRRVLRETEAVVLGDVAARCTYTIPKDLWAAEADEGQIGQVIHNVLLNAAQAMNNTGVIEVRAENLEVKAAPLGPLSPGNYVKLTFRDTGAGIPKEDLPHIFDPFFTTKPTGTGLGLAAAYGIIKRHHGHIQVQSQSGVGTEVMLYLPAERSSN